MTKKWIERIQATQAILVSGAIGAAIDQKARESFNEITSRMIEG